MQQPPETHFKNVKALLRLGVTMQSGERGSAVGDRASAVGGHGEPPEYGDGSDDLQDDGEARRWHRTLCKTPRAYAKYILSVWRWTWETCVALHPHSPLWQLLANGTFRGQRSTRSVVGSAPIFLLTLAVKVDDLEDHYARAGAALQTLIKAQGAKWEALGGRPPPPWCSSRRSEMVSAVGDRSRRAPRQRHRQDDEAYREVRLAVSTALALSRDAAPHGELGHHARERFAACGVESPPRAEFPC